MMPPPPPPRPPRKKANPWLILAIVIGAIANTAKSSPSIQATATAGVVQATATPIPTNTPVPLTQTVSSDVHFKAGEAASTPDGYAVTLNKTYTSAGGEFDTPAKGNQYFVNFQDVRGNGHFLKSQSKTVLARMSSCQVTSSP